MKKIKLLFVGMFISATILTSCGTEESTTNESTKTANFAKTTEMLNFESSLKSYFQAKREKTNEKLQNETNLTITKDSKALLVSIGKNDVANKTTQTTDELVRTAMKAYSQKLTEMYHEQIK